MLSISYACCIDTKSTIIKDYGDGLSLMVAAFILKVGNGGCLSLILDAIMQKITRLSRLYILICLQRLYQT